MSDYVKRTDQEAAFAPDKMRKVNLFGTPRLACDLYCFEPGQEQPAHAHEALDKLYLVLQGRGRVQIGSRTAEIGPGEVALAPAQQQHALSNPGPARLVVLAVLAPHP